VAVYVSESRSVRVHDLRSARAADFPQREVCLCNPSPQGQCVLAPNQERGFVRCRWHRTVALLNAGGAAAVASYCYGLEPYHLRPKRIPDLGEPAIFIAEIGIRHVVHGGEHVPPLRQNYSDGTRLSKIGGATEGAVVPVVKCSPGRAFQEKPPGEKHVPGKPGVKLAGIAIGADRGADVEPRSQKVVQDAALVFWTEAAEQHLDIDVGGTVFVSGRAVEGLKDANAKFVDSRRGR
jgi:hypothetical protein